MPPKKRPTQSDIARLAGVTQATVSFVLNDRNTISVPDETRKRILDAADSLGYRANALARGLASGNSSLIAVTLPAVSDFFAEVVHGIEDVARRNGYSVIISTTNDDPRQELANLDILASRQVDGTIICGSRLMADELSRVAEDHHLALLSSKAPKNAGIVKIPGEAGLHRITTHLIGLGHRSIGHIAWHPANENEREPGYMRALRDHDIEPRRDWIALATEASVSEGERCLEQILAASPEVTAITAYSDALAIGAIVAAKRLGRRIPEDLAVVGFDDIPSARIVSPALTTIHVPRYRTGQMLMESLLQVIESDGHFEAVHEVELSLVVRESCGAAQQRDATNG